MIKLSISDRGSTGCVPVDMVDEAMNLCLQRDQISACIGEIDELNTVVDNLLLVSKAIQTSNDVHGSLEALDAVQSVEALLGIAEDKLTVKAATEGLGQKIIDGIRNFFKMIANLIRRILVSIRNLFKSKDQKAREEAARIDKAADEALKRMSEKQRSKVIKAEWFKKVHGVLAANTGIAQEIGICSDRVVEAKDEAAVEKVLQELENRMNGKKEFFKTLYGSEPDIIEGESFADGKTSVLNQLDKYRTDGAVSCVEAGYTDIKDLYHTYEVISACSDDISKGIQKELENALKLLEQKCGVKDTIDPVLAGIDLEMKTGFTEAIGDDKSKAAARLVHRKGKIILTVVKTLRSLQVDMYHFSRATDIWDALNKEISSVAKDVADGK